MSCTKGAIAAIQFRTKPPLDFADIVEEFDISFKPEGLKRSLTWDCDDIALMDRGFLRIGLGWLAPDDDEGAWYLVLAVGPGPDAPEMPDTDILCNRLTRHILRKTKAYLPFDTVYHGTVSGAVDATLIDSVIEALQELGSQSCDDEPWVPPVAEIADARPVNTRAGNTAARGAGYTPNAHAERDTDRQITVPMHLSIYALGATMLVQAPPVGAALLVYTMLREEFATAA